MSVEAGSGTDKGFLSPPVAIPRGGRGGLLRRRLALAPGISEARGPSACLRRDALFRRTLLIADLLAVVGAFVMTVEFSHRSVALTWYALAALPIVVVCAKLLGLYDRDEALIRKTTLDEAPKLFELATLVALLGWLAGGMFVSGHLDRHEALFLWLSLAVLLVVMRAGARQLALRIAPIERCLFIGDELSAETIRSRLTGHGGVRADLVAHLDLDKVGPWSTDSFSEARLAEIRDLAQTLDVHRAIIAPRSVDAGEMLNLVRTLKAVGVRVSLLPRLLEVVGSSVEFDDLHGVTVMGVRRFDLTRSSARFKRIFDLLGASIGLHRDLAPAGGDRDRHQARQPRSRALPPAPRGPARQALLHAQVPHHGHQRRGAQGRPAGPQRGQGRALQDRRGPARDPRRPAPAPQRAGRAAQLWNIVRGEMSLVGPRPLVVDEDQRVEGWHRRRLELMPGMTGPWQILGPARVPLREMVAIDYLYVANWNLWSDVKILLRTVPHVLCRRGL